MYGSRRTVLGVTTTVGRYSKQVTDIQICIPQTPSRSIE